ncbi:GNAT family N-acetyltransferase [Streptosporangium sp. NBC_01755]|uniref:GNAT family N-acetyltransferase n=1 Tax=unclassified Streptosporangium TaxID=2632669 RepID=UPI002DDBB8B0|nr:MULTISPECIES: GNAT family N-acetyltransferase [unclassified Streptosporangium]WSA29197.1 GNAT family N-acetyltransferase [Streptosporangium sp. NBC_01810]WSC99358.1 GNAT family N-acetyltransferase [Streptosporangium sp. NBC_01755]
MGFLRIRTTVDERPGRLASLTAALAAKGGNILGLSVQTDADGTVDEFVTDIPAGAEAVREALEAAGGREVLVVPATAHELTDEPTRVLLLASRLRTTPWRLPELLGELLRADDSRWVYGAEMSDLPDPTLLTVPVAPRRAIRVRRAELPFTLTEAARAASFVRLAQPPAEQSGTDRDITLSNGVEVQIRPLTRLYRVAVRDLHDRCSPEARRFRYFTAMPVLPPKVFDRLCDRTKGYSIVAGHDGQVVGLANLLFTPDPGIAEMAFLVEDRWQGRGLGMSLAQMLVGQARDLGFAEVRATLFADNVRMRRLLVSLGATLSRTEDPGVLEARVAVGVVATASPS